MRLALLVLAYREPEVLRAALPIYKAAGMDVFVHLDRKADLPAYVSRLGEAAENCRFIDRRASVFWAGFSMIEAELALILAAMPERSYERFTLVSDDTFPLRSPAELRAYLEEDHDRVMLRKLDADDPFMVRYQKFFFLDHQATALLGRPIESAAVDEAMLHHMAHLQDTMRRGKKPIDIFYGSQWWSITRSSMETILGRLEDDSHLLESFRYSAVPDEIMFQSLIGNYVPISHVRGGPVYVEWGKEPKPYVFRTDDELNAIGKDYAFARKFSASQPDGYSRLRHSNIR
ncbi:beta-1,6-N-acetylglucosaminyltransferase [Rhizosaccharibacter radicis]|uniref:Peptide O-xylosyltransferase n=1 Tax=Rhizosaccharibacter radicis TaxID=2782605 RepID=A0ABT1VVY7_9PROT|nr:beta-1,6-N-acetylglucosaminyltransferase [Acetobacteraceae bacterium KSS12]